MAIKANKKPKKRDRMSPPTKHAHRTGVVYDVKSN